MYIIVFIIYFIRAIHDAFSKISWLAEGLVASQEGLLHGVSYHDYSKWSIRPDLEGKIQVMILNTIRLLSEENEETYEMTCETN